MTVADILFGRPIHKEHSIMARALIATIILSLIGTISGDVVSRLEAGTRECDWRPVTTDFYHIYTTLERKLQEAKISRSDLDTLYYFTTHEVDLWMDRLFLTRKSTTFVAALTQLKLLGDLDEQHCANYCAYVLARNNCNTASHLHACRPMSRKTYYVKIMIDAKVFPFMQRCLTPLMSIAIVQNFSLVESHVYEAVSLMTERMINFEPTSRWSTLDDMIKESSRPFLKVRQVVRPSQSKFWKNLAEIMLILDAQRGGNSLQNDIDNRVLRAPRTKQHYQRLVLDPCQKFIDKLHRTMDAVTFFGRTIDLRRSMFDPGTISNATKLEFFKISLLYETCVSLDNQEHPVNWSALNRELLFG